MAADPNDEPCPCMKCGHDVAAQADNCIADETYRFTCPKCGFIDVI